MSNGQEEPGKAPWSVVTVIVLVLVIYPLSIGPLTWVNVYATGKFGETVNTLYYAYCTPMRWIHTIGLLPQWYWDYLEWFVPSSAPTARP